jgi:hypothetical protein
LEGVEIENIIILYGHLEYTTAIWNILRPFGIFYGHWYLVVIWYIYPHFGMLYQEKSGNPEWDLGRRSLSAQIFFSRKKYFDLKGSLKDQSVIQHVTFVDYYCTRGVISNIGTYVHSFCLMLISPLKTM